MRLSSLRRARPVERPPHEKRLHPRFDRSFSVRLIGPDSSEEDARLLDIGGGGLRIETALPLAVGDRVGFRLLLPGKRPLAAHATVRWALAGGWRKDYGLELDPLGILDRESLLSCVDPDHFSWRLLGDKLLIVGAVLTLLWVAIDILRASPHVARALFSVFPFFVLAPLACLAAVRRLRKGPSRKP